MIAGADWNKRGCINLHARSHYSRIALHNVTILQGVTLNSFDEDNDVVPQRAVVRWINFFVQFFFFQILTSSLSLSFSLSLSPSKCNSFLYFFFGSDLERKFVLYSLNRLKNRLSNDIFSQSNCNKFSFFSF